MSAVVLRAPNGLLLREEGAPVGPGGVGWTSEVELARSWPSHVESMMWLHSNAPIVAGWLAAGAVQTEELDAARGRLGAR